MSGIPALGKKIYDLYVSLLTLLQAPFLLAIRAFWGWQLAQNGWGKWHNIGGVAEYFGTLNLPHPALFARGVATLELVGGSLLLLGLCSRPLALVLTGNMIGAYLTADNEAWHAFFTEDSGKFFAADPFPYLMVSVIVLFFGAGKLSVDEILSRAFGKQSGQKS